MPLQKDYCASIEKRVSSNGKVWEKRTGRNVLFNLEGKITSMTNTPETLIKHRL